MADLKSILPLEIQISQDSLRHLNTAQIDRGESKEQNAAIRSENDCIQPKLWGRLGVGVLGSGKKVKMAKNHRKKISLRGGSRCKTPKSGYGAPPSTEWPGLVPGLAKRKPPVGATSSRDRYYGYTLHQKF